MPYNYANTFFVGDVFFPDFPEGFVLSVNADGKVIPVPLPGIKSLTFYQNTPSILWQFTHDFNSFPFVIVYDSQGNDISAAINVVVDETTIEIHTDNSPISGRVEVFSFGTTTGIGSSSGRVTKSFTLDNSITAANDSTVTTNIQIAKVFQLFSFSSNLAIRFRSYISQERQIADLNRSSNTLITNETGLIFEGVTSDSKNLINLLPIATGYSVDGSINNYVTITNLSGSPLNTLNFTLTYLSLES